MRSRIEVWANWVYEYWLFIFVPPFLIVIFFLILYGAYTADPDLTDRSRRSKIFYELEAEMKGLEVPRNSAINGAEGNHKQSSILLWTRYRTDAETPEFFREMDSNLKRRGWISYVGSRDGSAERTFHYCRGKQDATLYLQSKGIFDSTPGLYWRLIFSMGLRSKPGLFGTGKLPAGCPDR